MPHVLWYKEGLKSHLMKMNDLIVKVNGQLSQKEYEQEITDLVNFLTYVSEPAQLERYSNWSLGNDIPCIFCIYYLSS